MSTKLLFLISQILLLTAEVSIAPSTLFNFSVSTLGKNGENLILFTKLDISDNAKSSTAGFVTNLHMVACKVSRDLATDIIAISNKKPMFEKQLDDLVAQINFKDCFQQTNKEYSVTTIEGDNNLPTKVIEEELFKDVFSEKTFEFLLFLKTLLLNQTTNAIQIHPSYLKNSVWNTPIPYTMDIERTAKGINHFLEFSNLKIKEDSVGLNQNESVQIQLPLTSPLLIGIVRFYNILQNKLEKGLEGVIDILFGNKNDHFRSDALFSINKILVDNYDTIKQPVSKDVLMNKIRTNKTSYKMFTVESNFKFFVNIISANKMVDIDFERDLKDHPVPAIIPQTTTTTTVTTTTTTNNKKGIKTTTSETEQKTDTTRIITTKAVGSKSKSKTWIIVTIIILMLALVGILITMGVIYRRRKVKNKTVSTRRRKMDL